MTIDTTTFLTALTVLAGGSGIAGIIVALSTRKKSKAEAAHIIEQAASDLVSRFRDHNTSLIAECQDLKGKVDTLTVRVDENETCQSQLTFKIEKLEEEKKTLQERVTKLTEQVEALQKENARLKQERENEKGLIA